MEDKTNLPTPEQMHLAVLQRVAEAQGRTVADLQADEAERERLEAEVNAALEAQGFDPRQKWCDKWLTSKETVWLLAPFYNAPKLVREARENTLPFGSVCRSGRWFYDAAGVMQYKRDIEAEQMARASAGRKAKGVE